MKMGGEVMKDYYSLIFLEKSTYGRNHTLYTEETMSILDDIEGLSDMIVQSELYHDFRAAQEMLNNDDEAHLMYQAF